MIPLSSSAHRSSVLSSSFLVLAGLAICLAIYFFAWSAKVPAPEKTNKPVSVVVGQVNTQVLANKVSVIGYLEAAKAVVIAPKESGRITQLRVRSGDNAKKGELLLTLDDSSLNAQLVEAQATLRDSKRQLSEIEALSKRGAASQSTLSSMYAATQIAETKVTYAKAMLAETQLIAPFTGKVGFIDHTVGALVSAGETIMTLDDVSTLRLDVAVPERYLSRVSLKTAAKLITDAYADMEFKAVVEVVDTRVNPNTRNFKVRLVLDNTKGLLKPGMLMRVSLNMQDSAVKVLPIQAVEFSGSDRFVYQVEDGVAHRRLVLLGRRHDQWVEVLDGIDEGATIVIRGLVSVRDGSKIVDFEQAATLPSRKQGH